MTQDLQTMNRNEMLEVAAADVELYNYLWEIKNNDLTVLSDDELREHIHNWIVEGGETNN